MVRYICFGNSSLPFFFSSSYFFFFFFFFFLVGGVNTNTKLVGKGYNQARGQCKETTSSILKLVINLIQHQGTDIAWVYSMGLYSHPPRATMWIVDIGHRSTIHIVAQGVCEYSHYRDFFVVSRMFSDSSLEQVWTMSIVQSTDIHYKSL